MSGDVVFESPPEDKGAPRWVVTFGDLMSLLMCFFVLLLSFAELDVLKYKQIAGAMKLAFGVQRDVKAMEIPKGTSVIAQQYSPGKPTKVTPLEIMREKTTDDTKTNLDFADTEKKFDVSNQTLEEAKAMAEEHAKQMAIGVPHRLEHGQPFGDDFPGCIVFRTWNFHWVSYALSPAVYPS